MWNKNLSYRERHGLGHAGINKGINMNVGDMLHTDRNASKHSLGLVFFPAFDWKISETHPERQERLLYTRDQIVEEGLLDIPNIKEYNPEKYWDYNLNSSDYGVECLTDLFERCQNFLDDVIIKNKDKKILIVSHASVIRCMHHILRNTDLNKEKLHISIPNSYFEVIELD